MGMLIRSRQPLHLGTCLAASAWQVRSISCIGCVIVCSRLREHTIGVNSEECLEDETAAVCQMFLSYSNEMPEYCKG